MRLEGLCQLKIAMRTSVIETATFCLVAQCLNRLRHRVPQILRVLHDYVSAICRSHAAVVSTVLHSKLHHLKDTDVT